MRLPFWKRAPSLEALVPSPEAVPLAALLTDRWLVEDAPTLLTLATLRQARPLLWDDAVSYPRLLGLWAALRGDTDVRMPEVPAALAPIEQRVAELRAADPAAREALRRFLRALCAAYRLQAHAFGLFQRIDPAATSRPAPAGDLSLAYPATYGGHPRVYLNPAGLPAELAALGPRVAGALRPGDEMLEQCLRRSLARGVPAWLHLDRRTQRLCAAVAPGPRWTLFDVASGQSEDRGAAEIAAALELDVQSYADGDASLDDLPSA